MILSYEDFLNEKKTDFKFGRVQNNYRYKLPKTKNIVKTGIILASLSYLGQKIWNLMKSDKSKLEDLRRERSIETDEVRRIKMLVEIKVLRERIKQNLIKLKAERHKKRLERKALNLIKKSI